MKALFARAVSVMIVVFARAVTAVRAIWPESGPPQGQCIYFANHSSHGDFILIWSVLPPWMRVRTRPVAGADYWLKSSLNRFIGCDVFAAVLIERDREKRLQDPIAVMSDALDAGSSLILFPEGTRNETEARLLPFRSGLYNLAMATRPDIPLVPVWIDNLNRVMPKGEIVPIPLICTVTFGEALIIAPDEAREIFLARATDALLALAPKPLGDGQ
ncbi:lysophospholipid acyltransferase family protein [Pararhizobium antarcticum]|uniref:Acyl-phosphate glycerol 3-phosphate acyltransferase n=1 Tax=Pararhizobium antarcticum TaxID=1798805 RepID=A0A657LQ81_9HYPH|nr:lysophospholipid acyltransferase family protein [Pararhizobium antarcticum]OJF95055.1 acyl-phosphate glycerol 3-phosphate acyltransferase [Pararhizobium antarcticum]OJF98124.1 acyl-phosphate glycerol 3-phosphate acyltransferase [Rhizobium sp. 58]